MAAASVFIGGRYCGSDSDLCMSGVLEVLYGHFAISGTTKGEGVE